MKPNCIFSALCRFGVDELLSIVPAEGRNALTAMIPQSDQESFDKHGLALVVMNNFSERIIGDDQLRRSVILRMNPDELKQSFPSLLGNTARIQPSHFDLAVEFAKHNAYRFAEDVGLTEAYFGLFDSKIPGEATKRISPSFALFPYQADVSDEVLNRIRSGEKRLLIHLPTGSGKTRTAMNIAAEHLRENRHNLVVWLADREELCDQAMDTFVAAWKSLGKHDCTAYSFYSDRDDGIGGIDSGMFVASLQKIMALKRKKKKNLSILYRILTNSATLVIIDEAHKAVAQEYRSVLEDFTQNATSSAPLIGLTATPGRKFSADGPTAEDYNLSSFFGENKVTMNVTGYPSPIEYLVTNGYLAKAAFIPLNYDYAEILGHRISKIRTNPNEMAQVLINSKERNSVVLDTIEKEVKNGSQAIVFATSVEHANILATILSYRGIKAVSVDSKNDNIISRRIKIKKYLDRQIQVITNYNVLTAGFDAPNTNVVVIARPVQSLVQYMQMAGRGMRGIRSKGNAACRIYTVMDQIPEFRNMYLAFEYWDEMWN